MNRYITIITILLCALLQANPLKAATLYNLEPDSKELGDMSRIRVKVFPHDGQLPHKEESNKKQITLRSSEECLVFSAQKHATEPTSEWLMTAEVIDIAIKDTRLPIWIRCEATVSLWAKGAQESMNYRGDLYIREVETATGAKELEVINVLDLEEYLRGVVPAEVYPNWPVETLKSQTVAARTYALYHMHAARVSGVAGFSDVDDTVRFQAYSGIQAEHPNTNDAVDATRGEVLTYKNAIFPAYYHADSGGMTERGEEVWSKALPFVRSRKETFLSRESAVTWQLALPAQKIQPRLNELAGTRLQDVVKVSVREEARTKTGRVRFVSFYDAEGRVADLTVNQFRRLMGKSLPSTMFNVILHSEALSDASKFALVVSGQGSGHGVGLSQRGAAELGKRMDWDYRKILDYYYRGVDLCRFGAGDAQNSLKAKVFKVHRCKMGQAPNSAPTQASKTPRVS